MNIDFRSRNPRPAKTAQTGAASVVVVSAMKGGPAPEILSDNDVNELGLSPLPGNLYLLGGWPQTGSYPDGGGSGPGGGNSNCQQGRILKAIPGTQPSDPPYDVNQGGHEQFGISTNAAALAGAGFAPFSFLGANGYRNNAVFWSIHINGQFGAQLTANGPFTNIQAHIDLFNPATGLLGILGHGIWDLGIGSLFFNQSNALDPGCH